MWYPNTIPRVLQRLYPQLLWSIATQEKVLYLTFDDGPTPDVTKWVLDSLDQRNAKGTFFCIGDNVHSYKCIYDEILNRGHQTGNHTQLHLNGWKTDTNTYIEGVLLCAEVIKSTLFRPPYGRMTRRQRKALLELDYKIVMWDVLSGDFDESITGEKCAQSVIKYARSGSIVVFHDSVKAFPRLQVALPIVLEHFTALGYRFEALPL